MDTAKTYEKYPIWIVILSNLVSLSIYGLGFVVIFRLGLIFSIIYLMYAFILEYRLIKYHCVNCYYYGKTCGFGRGRLSSLLFENGDVSRFCIKEMTFKDMIPDILISLIPFVIGIALLTVKFEFFLLFTLLLMLILSTIVSAYIRGTLTCKYCKQKELGCPADKLFNKEEC